MTDLIAFLRARLDEDERIARGTDTYSWVRVPDEDADEDGEGRVETSAGRIVIWDHGCHLSRHIARHEPARVLREVEAKRRILDWAEGVRWLAQLLAVAYADHPDYDVSWRPS